MNPEAVTQNGADMPSIPQHQLFLTHILPSLLFLLHPLIVSSMTSVSVARLEPSVHLFICMHWAGERTWKVLTNNIWWKLFLFWQNVYFCFATRVILRGYIFLIDPEKTQFILTSTYMSQCCCNHAILLSVKRVMCFRGWKFVRLDQVSSFSRHLVANKECSFCFIITVLQNFFKNYYYCWCIPSKCNKKVFFNHWRKVCTDQDC